MEIAVRRPSIIFRPAGIVLAILLAVALWWLFSGNPSILALLVIAALFLLGLKKPIWAIGALLVSQLTVTSYMIDTPFGFAISLRLLLLILTLILLWRTSAHDKLALGAKARWVIIPITILVIISAAANLANSSFDYVFTDLRNMAGGLLIVILLPAVVRNLRDLKILLSVAFIGIIASSIIGLMQQFQFLGMSEATTIPGFIQATQESAGIPGMSETQLELAFLLPVGLLTMLGIYLAKGLNNNTRILILLSMVLMAIALYFTFTRSALFALVPGIAALFLFLKTRVKAEIIVVVMFLVLGLVETVDMPSIFQFGGRSEASQEESATSRPILWQAGVAIALDNPILGIGGDQFISVSPQYASSVDPSLLSWEEERYWGYSTLGSEELHNDFLKMWVSYGTFALLTYVWLYVAVLRNCVNSYHMSKRAFIKGLSVGLGAALVAYGINSFYHNCLQTFPLLWIIVGFSLATSKLALMEGNTEVREQVAKPNQGKINSDESEL
jgi:O-antigen ligase